MITIVLKSLLLGFLITLPLGPIGILCLHRILQLGALKGFILGLSQTLATFIFSIIVIFSLGAISDYIIKYQFWIRLIGGLALIVFGVTILFSKSSLIINKVTSKKRFIADFFSITFLMLISPATLVVFFILSEILELYTATRLLERIEMILGISIGSFICWALVCLCFIGYKKKATRNVMTWINRFTGSCLMGFGIAVCATALF